MNIVAFGGGTNSTAMIIGLHKRNIPIDLILFADTGAEQPHTYTFIDTFNQWLTSHGLPQITPVFYSDKFGNRLNLEDECLRSGTLPSIAYGYKKCSLKHKIGIQDKYCNNLSACKAVWDADERCNKFIGYDRGETRRIQHAAKHDAKDKKYTKHYPLIDWDWSREDCQEVIEAAGLPTPGKSSCFFCPSMKKAEIQALWERYPQLWERAIDIERMALPNLTSIKGLGRNWSWESYQKAFYEAKKLQDMQITLDEFIETTGGCICGAPCGCYDG
jgi:3'-phosphoadenosine 5'-phosphosulfate sulfotransferase (PAPS reductase)/FAD synthetase